MKALSVFCLLCKKHEFGLQMIRNLTTYTPDFSVIDTSLDSSNSKGRLPQDFPEKHSIISTPSKASKREHHMSKNPQQFPQEWKYYQSIHLMSQVPYTAVFCGKYPILATLSFWPKKWQSGNSGELSQTLAFRLGRRRQAASLFRLSSPTCQNALV